MDKLIQIWDMATGKGRFILENYSGWGVSVAFSPDSKTLAGTDDKIIKLWDMSAEAVDKKAEPARSGILAAEDLDALWTTLAGDDAAQAYKAIGTLVRAPDQAVPLAKERLRPASKPNTQEISRWITDLGSEQFTVRQKATEALEKLGDVVEPALRMNLEAKPSLEVRQRIENLLRKIEQLTLRHLRAIEVLEHIGSVEAKGLLERLATGAEGARLTKEAKASLDRLNKRVAGDK